MSRPSDDLERAYPRMGQITVATRVVSAKPDSRRTATIIILLTCSVALMMTGMSVPRTASIKV